jgi:hypothetical protein
MILSHFTSAYHLHAIATDGYLKVTESNISLLREHAGPDVVWLTDNTEPTSQCWARGSVVDKTGVRFIVNVPDEDVYPWRTWAFDQGIDQFTFDALAQTGGDSDRWFVVTRPIPVTEWVDVHVRDGALPVSFNTFLRRR